MYSHIEARRLAVCILQASSLIVFCDMQHMFVALSLAIFVNMLIFLGAVIALRDLKHTSTTSIGAEVRPT